MIASIVGGLLLAVAAVLLVPVAVFAVQVVAARRCLSPVTTDPATARPTTAVLMPAHDEAAGIAAAIDTVLPQLRATTGSLSWPTTAATRPPRSPRHAVREVIERHHPDRRGKGYALDHGVRHLRPRRPRS